jgi:hypothetical protein
MPIACARQGLSQAVLTAGERKPLAMRYIGRIRTSYSPPGAKIASPAPLLSSTIPSRSSGTTSSSNEYPMRPRTEMGRGTIREMYSR